MGHGDAEEGEDVELKDFQEKLFVSNTNTNLKNASDYLFINSKKISSCSLIERQSLVEIQPPELG